MQKICILVLECSNNIVFVYMIHLGKKIETRKIEFGLKRKCGCSGLIERNISSFLAVFTDRSRTTPSTTTYV